MKKLLFLLAALSLLLGSCSSSEESPEDEFSQRQVTKTELEANGGMWLQNKSSTTYYLRFKNGAATIYEYKEGEFKDIRGFTRYSLNGDSITLEETPIYQEILGGETKYYTLYINYVHWGNEKEDQLLIRGNNPPYKFQTGYYSKDIDFTE